MLQPLPDTDADVTPTDEASCRVSGIYHLIHYLRFSLALPCDAVDSVSQIVSDLQNVPARQ